MGDQPVQIDPETKETMERACGSLFNLLKRFEKEALAMELASLLVGAGYSEVAIRSTLVSLKENSDIAVKNRQITSNNRKLSRLTDLSKKKKLNKSEQAEANKLIRELEKKKQI